MCRDADLQKMGAHCVTGGVFQARASRTPGMCPWSHQGSDAEGEGKVCLPQEGRMVRLALEAECDRTLCLVYIEREVTEHSTFIHTASRF